MPRIAYVNGRYTRHAEACVHIEDRGYQFADGVYEVCEVARGQIMDMTRHLDRLDRSLRELRIEWPLSRRVLQMVMGEVVRRNRIENGLVYLQVTRGVAPRDHYFPASGTAPAIVVTAKRSDPAAAAKRASQGVKVITVRENRWERVDIKTVGLLPNVLARQQAKEAGAVEAWFVDLDGVVKEGASTNAWIVTPDGKLVTRPADHGILRGVTRATVMDVAKKLGLTVEERGFSVEEAKQAKEAFITAATTVVMPVVAIDDASVANGHPGSVTLSLRDAFFDIAEKTPA
ncbi:D-amino-acid transaminase [Mesorhizobium microcysteis]|jgi:D-alanine transaminase|uniref:Probable branched-chain-amino-acid aminotransferase n=1 Tax=Neoaquamicrobium microcysteis TaxID=2682781 RepID=A0A5D4GQU3_9HYPH|nr:D-amino-acid transaminase [Mesorhizobium microcysteis]TYR31126.1 D-amino-acid transaminase [Mesorhizobium microcysteis]